MKKFFLLCGTAAVCASLAVPAAADTVLATRGTQVDGTLLQDVGFENQPFGRYILDVPEEYVLPS